MGVIGANPGFDLTDNCIMTIRKMRLTEESVRFVQKNIQDNMRVEKMNLGPLKEPKMMNIVLAIVATLVIAFIKKDFGIGNLVLCFVVAYLLLYFIDFLDRFMKKRLEKKMFQRANRK